MRGSYLGRSVLPLDPRIGGLAVAQGDAEQWRMVARMYQKQADEAFKMSDELRRLAEQGDTVVIVRFLARWCAADNERCGILLEDAAESIALGADREFRDALIAELPDA